MHTLNNNTPLLYCRTQNCSPSSKSSGGVTVNYIEGTPAAAIVLIVQQYCKDINVSNNKIKFKNGQAVSMELPESNFELKVI